MYRDLVNITTHQVTEQHHISLPVGSLIVQIVATRKPTDTLVRKAAGNDKIYCTDKITTVYVVEGQNLLTRKLRRFVGQCNVVEGAAVLGYDARVI